jgi:hypothetical protein
MPKIAHWFSKIVGTSHSNDDGSSRQSYIAECIQFEKLNILHDEDNQFSKKAIKVCRENGTQLGFLNQRLATEIFGKSKKGYQYAVFATEITGGGSKTRGVNLLIVQAEPDASEEAVQKYVSNLDLTDRISLQSDDSENANPNFSLGIIVVAIIIAILVVWIILKDFLAMVKAG